MASKYNAILTDVGAEKIARAPIEGRKLVINQFAVGDGNGSYYQPTPDQTSLRNEKYRGDIVDYSHHKQTIKISGIIPADVGGFTIREMCLFDTEGDMIAISNTALIEKPLPLDGITYQMRVGMTIEINGSIDDIKIVIDNINYIIIRDMIEEAKQEVYRNLIKPGTIEAFAGNGEPPEGFLICNGAEISRVTYADLFAAIGTTYGSGDGLTTFNLPDLTARFVMGDTIAGQVKEAGLPEISGRTLLYQYTGWTENTFGAFTAATTGSGTATNTSEVLNIKDVYFNFNASRSNPIYGKSDTVQPPALTMKYIIKY